MADDRIQYMARIPRELYQQAEAMAEHNFTVINSIICQALSEKWLRHVQSVNATLPIETSDSETQTA